MKIRLVLAVIPAVLVACQSSPSAKYEDRLKAVDELSAKGLYEEALLAAEAYHNKHPKDAEGTRQFQRAQAAVILEQARQLCFLDKNLEALQLVRQARVIEPEERVIADWEHKLEAKLAGIHATNGDEFFASSDLEAAREHYESALGYVADDPRAKAGLSQVLLMINYRRGMGEQYYEDGVHLLREYWLEQARTRFDYVNKYQPKNERAKNRQKIASNQLAASRCTLANQLEGQGLWAAARNEYRIALLLDDDHPDALSGFARTRIEASAEEKLREIERFIRNKQYEKARESIASGRAITKYQADKFEGALAAIEEALLESSYIDAVTLEADQDYVEAIAAYDKLLAQRDYYKDALARRDTLKTYVEKAAGLYKQAMDSTDPEEKLRLLRQIALFWPEYENVEELILLLKPAATPSEPEKPGGR